jgi:tRNA(adenine34) deaminase
MVETYMKRALELAEYAATLGEVPVGAVVVHEGKIIAEGYNQRETSKCVTRHAEIRAIEEACRVLGGWRLVDCTLYVTLEPCLMCAGALYQARIAQVYYGCNDPKFGALGSLYTINTDARLNHRFEVFPGHMQQESAQMLQDFFKARRNKN